MKASLPRLRRGALLLIGLIVYLSAAAGTAQRGPLRITSIAPHNLIIDSNGGYAPEVVHLGVTICNDGTAPLHGVRATIGEAGTYVVPSSTDFIAKVELVAQFYVDGTISNDALDLEVVIGGVAHPFNLTASELQAYQGIANAGMLAVDITHLQNWDWNSFAAYGVDDHIFWRDNNKATPDPAVARIDAVGFRVTTDGAPTGCEPIIPFDPATGLAEVPLVYTYDTSRFAFAYADVAPDSIAPDALYFQHVRTLSGGQAAALDIHLLAKSPVTAPVPSSTLASVSGARFGSGRAANTDQDAASVTITPSGSFAGRLWNDVNANGWSNGQSYEPGIDYPLAGARVVLSSCDDVSNNGSCKGTVRFEEAVISGTDGSYRFAGLAPGIAYRIEVDPTALPGTPAQTGDPDDGPYGAGDQGTCGSGNSNAACDGAFGYFVVGTDLWNGSAYTLTDFGYQLAPSLGGTLWRDSNADGVRAATEGPLEGVPVELKDGHCTPGTDCPTAITDREGHYRFENLSANTAYTLGVVIADLPQVGNWYVTAESDAQSDNAITHTLATGQNVDANDFGLFPAGSGEVSGVLYYDYDEDGARAPNAEGLPGIPVALYADTDTSGIYEPHRDPLLAVVYTDATGHYRFGELPLADYHVRVRTTDTAFPVNTLQTGDPDEARQCTVCDDQSLIGVAGDSLQLDFGYKTTGEAVIEGLVWTDLNGDGVQLGINEQGLPQTWVRLFTDANADGLFVLRDSVQTTTDGSYRFERLADGAYRVAVSPVDPQIPLDASGVRFSPTLPVLTALQLSDGTTGSQIGFGFAQLASIGDVVFYDANANGSFDQSETGAAGVSVYLCAGQSGCSASTALRTVVTSDGSNGLPVGGYQFVGLEPGYYSIAVETTTGPLAGTQATADPDADGLPCDDPQLLALGYAPCDEATVQSVGYGTTITGSDFGFRPAGVMGGRVWLDANADGTLNYGEPGLFDVAITLTNQSPILIGGNSYPAGTYSQSVQTDSEGAYSFANFPDGAYTLTSATPAGKEATHDPDGTADNQVTVTISQGATTIAGHPCTSNCALLIDFGYKLFGSQAINGTVCIDSDADGFCFSADDAPVADAVLYLYDAAGNLLGSTTTGPNGTYGFVGLPDGQYTLAVSTTVTPLDLSVTTNVDVTNTGATAYRPLTIAGNTLLSDFGFVYNVALDLGDLPASYGITTLAEGGAYHLVAGSPTVYLGASNDSEMEPTQNATATGDPDDDGIQLSDPTEWTLGADGGYFGAQIVGDGYLVGWIDFNHDGDPTDPGEMVVNQAVTATPITRNSTDTTGFAFDVPADADLSGTLYARFRLFEEQPAFPQFSFAGEAIEGEVEDYAIVSSAVLPVSLARFVGGSDGCAVRLQWTAAAEHNFSHYAVERSRDGRVFSTIAEVAGTGTALGSADYSYTDTDEAGGYYRLRMVDIDGTTDYSLVVPVFTDCQEAATMAVYPTVQAHGREFRVSLTGVEGESTLQFFDYLGQPLHTVTVAGPEAAVDTRGLPEGTYIVHLVGSRLTQTVFLRE